MDPRSVTRVVVVDDEKVIASTVAAILQMNGFSAQFFVHPLQALEAMNKEQPDLLISDVMMPELSGFELAIRVKALSPNCKILLFSGQGATADLLLQARAQGHDFQLLAKPIHPTELLSRVGRLVGKAVTE